MDVCKLCLEIKKLSLSHLVPKAFIKSAKIKSPQLIKMSLGTDRRPLMVNANWTERLLCEDCEKLLNFTYEAKQIAFLRRYKEFQAASDRITFTGLQPRQFYLLWLSILWRASISSVEPFKNFSLGKELDEVMRLAILHRTPRFKEFNLTSFVSIGLVKLAPDEFLAEDVLPQMLSNIYPDQEGKLLYFFVEGWCICYVRAENAESYMPASFGRIKDSGLLRVPVRKAADIQEIAKIFDQMGAYADTHSGWRGR